MLYRHGDLLLKSSDEPVSGPSTTSLTLAEGEVTGHRHTLIADVSSEIIGNSTRFTLTGRATLTHQEHGTITLQPGTYTVIHEREFDYADAAMKSVVD